MSAALMAELSPMKVSSASMSPEKGVESSLGIARRMRCNINQAVFLHDFQTTRDLIRRDAFRSLAISISPEAICPNRLVYLRRCSRPLPKIDPCNRCSHQRRCLGLNATEAEPQLMRGHATPFGSGFEQRYLWVRKLANRLKNSARNRLRVHA